MIIKNLKIIGLRNLAEAEFSFCENKNLVYGSNGTGKTTVLEAIFLSGFGKSFLNAKKSDLVNYNRDEFSINLLLKKSSGEKRITTFYCNKISNRNFSLSLDGKRANIFEISEYYYPLFFSSSNYSLYIESKPYIRKLMNRFIFGVYALYIHYILSYNKALKQKNYLLKTRQNIVELSSWNKMMSEFSEKIVGIRMEFVDKLNNEIRHRYGRRLEIRYNPSLFTDAAVNRENYFNELEKIKDKEIRFTRSLKGPHLDNFEIYLDSKNLSFYSSGEKKINLLMIYISFIEIFKKMKNEYPIFLVDDFDTAIDSKNIDFLINNYPDLQVIATSVNKNSNFDNLIQLGKEN